MGLCMSYRAVGSGTREGEELVYSYVWLLPDTNSSESCSGFCRQFITQMARQLVSASYSSLLVLVKVRIFLTFKELYIVLENAECVTYL